MSEDANVILSAAKAGKEALSLKHFTSAKNLKIISDVNAVPPSGVEGLEVNSNGEKIKNSWSEPLYINVYGPTTDLVNANLTSSRRRFFF